MQTTTYTAAVYLAAYEPAVIALMDNPATLADDLAGDTLRAHAVAAAGGLPVDPNGSYPALVWFAVFG